jgi:hypothetical protein
MNRRSVLLFAFVALPWLPAHAQQGEMHMHGHFDDAGRWAQVFDDPERDAWQKPDEVLRALALAPDAAVADVGSGTGYFAVRFARALPKGRVYGADLSHDMVHYLNQRAAKESSPISPRTSPRPTTRGCRRRSTWRCWSTPITISARAKSTSPGCAPRSSPADASR